MIDVCLGKQPPKKYYGEVAVKLIDHIDLEKALPATRASQTWGGGIHFGMFLNDIKSCCTCTAYGHAEQVHSTKSRKPEHPKDEYVFELYHETGVEQGLSDDDGRYMLGVLKHLIEVGFKQADGSYEKILGYAAVNPLNHDEVRVADQFFGGTYFGAALPLSASDQIEEGKAWTVSQDADVNAPGSWGGHAMWSTGYNIRGPRSVTWSKAQQMTWEWWDRYVDEQYVVITKDWVQNVTSPSGMRTQDLLDLLKEING